MGLVSEMVWGGQVSRLGLAAGTKESQSALPHHPSVRAMTIQGRGLGGAGWQLGS